MTRKLEIIVTHCDEPWSVGKMFFDMLAMQRDVWFCDVRVILVQDGILNDNTHSWGSVLNGYPFQVKVLTINRSGPAAARNAGLQIATADWVMFCDFDDAFADLATLNAIMQVIPNDTADVIWMRSFREERMRATMKDDCRTFINCVNENFESTDGKLYRRSMLDYHSIRFCQDLMFQYQSAFNHMVLSFVPSHRVMKLAVDFYPYLKTFREDSWTMRPSSGTGIVDDTFMRDMFLANEYEKRGWSDLHQDMVAETFFDAYYLLNSKPDVQLKSAYERAFDLFFERNCSAFESMRKAELEVIHENCFNKVLNNVQRMYNYFGIETILPDEGMDNAIEWLRRLHDPQIDEAPVPDHAEPPAPGTLPKYTGPRVAVYCGTRNVYEMMCFAAKSLLRETKVDKIYFLTEDDEFPFEIPDIIENINIAHHDLMMHLNKFGPNYNNSWTYMCLVRAFFPALFKQYDRILSLDIDTTVHDDISDLWDLDLTDYYYAGVPEPGRQKDPSDPVYCNFGVIMMNLKKLRDDEKDEDVLHMINTTKLGCPEQDAFNRVCAGHILPLPADYNDTLSSHITGKPERTRIIHYAGIKYWKHFRPVQEVADIPWSEITEQQKGDHNVSTEV